jgi:hypothetical protein
VVANKGRSRLGRQCRAGAVARAGPGIRVWWIPPSTGGEEGGRGLATSRYVRQRAIAVAAGTLTMTRITCPGQAVCFGCGPLRLTCSLGAAGQPAPQPACAGCRASFPRSSAHRHPQSKRPSLSTGPFRGTLTMTYFRAVYPALSSARRRFTVLFGMGRRGTNALCSSEKLGGGRHAAPPSGMVLGCVFNAGRSNRVV